MTLLSPGPTRSGNGRDAIATRRCATNPGISQYCEVRAVTFEVADVIAAMAK